MCGIYSHRPVYCHTLLWQHFIRSSAQTGTGSFTRSSVLQLEVLIRELPSIDRLPPSSVVVGEISTLKTGIAAITL